MPTDQLCYHGIVPPICTPMTESFDVDTRSLERMIEFQLDAGVHGLFMLGSTSETAFLTDQQRSTVLDVAVRTNAGRVPIFAGIIDTTTAPCLEHAAVARDAGVDALVVTAPFYARVSQAEIIEHFRMIKQHVNLPIIAYDVPSAVGTKLEKDTVTSMAEEQLVVGIKDSSGNEANFRSLLLDTRSQPGFAAFTGSELIVDAAILMGASGSVPGLGNVDPEGYVRLYEAACAGNWDAARAEQERLFRLFSIIYAGTPGRMGAGSSAIGGFKTALYLRGIFETNVVGRPLTRMNSEETERVRAALAEAEVL